MFFRTCVAMTGQLYTLDWPDYTLRSDQVGCSGRLTSSPAPNLRIRTRAARNPRLWPRPMRSKLVLRPDRSRVRASIVPTAENKSVRNGPATIVDQLRSLELQEPGAAAAAVYDQPIALPLLYEEPASCEEHYLVPYPARGRGRAQPHTAAPNIVGLEGPLQGHRP